MNKEIQKNKYIFKYNIFFTLLAGLINFLAYKFLPDTKNHFIEYSIIINGFLLYIYYTKLFSKMRKMIVGIKKEMSTANIPFRILFFFILLICILIWNITTIYKINPEAVNILFVSNVFIKTITNNLSLLLILLFMFIITPAIIIPNYDNTKYKKANNILLALLLFLFGFMAVEIYINASIQKMNLDISKYELNKITYEYNKKYLEYENITESAKAEIEKNKAFIPFAYTKREKTFFSYEEAEAFCKSMGAKVSSVSEIYNIVFNRFETNGNNTYWTSDSAGRTPVIFQNKNLNYIVKKADKRTKANVICTANTNEKHLFAKEEIKNTQVSYETKEFSTYDTEIDKEEMNSDIMNIPSEFIGFDIIFANEQYFNKMLTYGYKYNKSIKINPINQIEDFTSINKIKTEGNNVKFCHFPFMDFINFTIDQEKEVWASNFCIPSFEILDVPQETKTQYEKDAYCQAHGGRIPNIAELSGIIKTTNKVDIDSKYWVRNTVSKDNIKKHIYLTNLGDQIYNVEIAKSSDEADVICIKSSNSKTNIIANFASRFPNESGAHIAKQKCPICDYYEMPDMVLNQ